MATLLISDIKSSISVPELIKDEFIRNGIFIKNKMGNLIMYSGGFTAVFKCNVNGEIWAFRCWHTDLGSMKTRFQLLSTALENNPLEYFCDFKYVDEGIVVNGKIYPTTRMKWIDGLTIKDYIYQHKNDKDKLDLLSRNFLEMCKDMHSHHFAHGDLQHGNIIVNDIGKLFLIDYDSLYHVSMGNMPDIITGIKDYQHPARMKNSGKATEKLDYFSELIIYICIRAIAANPSLADKYNLEDADWMLFQAKDFTDIVNSEIYHDLNSLGDEFTVLLEILSVYLSHGSINELEPIEKMLESMMGEPAILSFDTGVGNIAYTDDKIILSWETQHAYWQSINGEDIEPTDRQHRITLTKDATLTLTVGNALKRVSKKIDIKAVKKPEILFMSDKKRLRKNHKQTFTLRWHVSNASSVVVFDEIHGQISNELSGEKNLTIDESTDYTIKVVGLDGQREFTKKINIEVCPESIVTFNVDKQYSFPGIPVTLEWQVQNADTVMLTDKGVVPNNGQLVIKPEKDTTMSLKVKDKFGIRTYQKTIKMLPLPVVYFNSTVPNFNSSIVIATKIPQFNSDLRLPNVQIDSSIGTENLSSIFSLSPTFVQPKFSLKRESLFEGFADVAKQCSKNIIHKLNNIIHHDKRI